jgi:hypothetical protein
VTRPKRIGGLDVLDLERFNKALRLCWPWLLWTDNNKPWHHLPPSSSSAKTALFRTCIEIHLGDGQEIRFWHDRWIVGQGPRDITSALYKLAWCKNNTVAEAICNGKWMRGLRRISTTPEVSQFVHLWTLVHQVQLTSQPNNVSWCFTTNGKYSAKSAYNAQFIGSFSDHDWKSVWHASMENECKFFSWLVLQNRL